MFRNAAKRSFFLLVFPSVTGAMTMGRFAVRLGHRLSVLGPLLTAMTAIVPGSLAAMLDRRGSRHEFFVLGPVRPADRFEQTRNPTFPRTDRGELHVVRRKVRIMFLPRNLPRLGLFPRLRVRRRQIPRFPRPRAATGTPCPVADLDGRPLRHLEAPIQVPLVSIAHHLLHETNCHDRLHPKPHQFRKT